MNRAGKQRAMIAMSGGVDSSVAALLAMRMGYDCEGVTMKLFADEDVHIKGDSACFSHIGASDAARVASSLGMPHHIIDFTDEFRMDVIEPFVSAYEKGSTPNPCIDCNVRIKFGRLLERAREMGFDKLVTGHYARIVTCPGGSYRLARAADPGKDQSYFLYGLDQEQLSHTLFPLGGLTKGEARAIAEEAGFVNAKKPESQDICFVKEGGHAKFIEKYRGEASAPGYFIDTSGRVLGRHGGIARYTVGQRKGLGIALGRPVFVKEIRAGTGEIVLAGEEEVFAGRIEIIDANIPADVFGSLSGCREGDGKESLRAQIMIRYNAKPVWATARPIGSGCLTAEFDEPVRAPAKGQAAVLYDGDLVVGGGRIQAAY